MELSEKLLQTFQEHFGGQPDLLVEAPGRVNLIGEHTDYNGGFVLPMAMNRSVMFALRYRKDGHVHLLSGDHLQHAHFDCNDFSYVKPHWCEYIKGVANGLKKRGLKLQGFEGVLMGDVPRGSGLSSSAALELAAARAFSEVSGFPWDPVEMAVVGQEAENDWVGVNCGIMDQMISACGKAGHAYLLDCRSLEGTHVPLPEGFTVVILDTATRRGLVDSAYNERREQCEAAAAFFGVELLRDVPLELFLERQAELDELTRKRARHVVTEDARTLAASEAMKAGDAEAFGQRMTESHESLRDDFEVSNDALNTMVETALEHEGCLGARMTGAGFGGCAVALVKKESAGDFAGSVTRQYQEKTGLEPAVYVTPATDGARRILL
jgi:galactokinase